jgi:hypothetical protein
MAHLIRAAVAGVGLTASLCLGAAGAAHSRGQKAPAIEKTGTPPIQTLRLRDTTTFSSPMPNAFRSGAKCDSENDIFLQALNIDPNQLAAVRYSPIAEIGFGSKQVTTFGTVPLPVAQYPHQDWEYFQVDSSGTLYALLFARQDAKSEDEPRPAAEYYMERFNTDGTVDSLTRLQAPPNAGHWWASLFGIFPGG